MAQMADGHLGRSQKANSDDWMFERLSFRPAPNGRRPLETGDHFTLLQCIMK